jgi:hypothetical protein
MPASAVDRDDARGRVVVHLAVFDLMFRRALDVVLVLDQFLDEKIKFRRVIWVK